MMTDQPYKRHERIGDCDLYLGDCLEVMPTLGTFEAVVTDPPYGKVRGDFDHQWTNRAAMLPSVDLWLEAMVPAIKANGSLWWFAWPSLAGQIEARIADKMNILAHVVWEKPAAQGQKASKEALRAPMPLTERILFAEHYGADNMALGESGYQRKSDELRGFVFEPLRAYLASEWEAAGLTRKDANEATGSQMAGHYFSTVQWALPTKEAYEKLQEMANRRSGAKYLRKDYEYLRKDYEYLRKDYEDLRKDYEDLRRWFDCRAGDQFSDIWRFPVDAPSARHGHPTQKPRAIMEYIVRLSVRPSGAVLDPFLGSGTTGVACVQLGRKFTGIEIDPDYFDIACRRIQAAVNEPRLDLPEPVKRPEPMAGLFDDQEDAQ